MLEYWTRGALLERVVISVVAGLLSALILWLIRLSWEWFRTRRAKIKALENELRRLRQRLTNAEGAVTGDGLWLARPNILPENYSLNITNSIPIITIANLKGGVGKTTLTANLARFYAGTGKRVLAIDLDYQGSLSSLAVTGEQPEILSIVSRVIKGEHSGETLLETVQPMINAPHGASILTAAYELARVENQVMVHWLTQREERDARYFLADCLHSNAIQENYDIILIDAAPRITTGIVQALCASTHVLVPTKLDALSADAVSYFIQQIFNMDDLWPHLKIMGIVGTMTQHEIARKTDEDYDNDALVNFEADAILRIQSRVESVYNQNNKIVPERLILPYRTFIPGKRSINRLAGEREVQLSKIPAGARAQIKSIFERLGREIANRVDLKL